MDERLVGVGYVAAGGFVGATLRYGLSVGLGGPVGTLAVNLLGSFALGLAVSHVTDRRVRLFLATGLLSSFTTYSTFAVESVGLGPTLGAANVVVSYALGVTAAALGLAVGGRLVTGAGGRR
jgi:CrcB protein